MNDYVVTSDDKKFNVSVNSVETIRINDKNYKINLSKISDYAYLLKVDNKVYQIAAEKNNNSHYSFFINGFSIDLTVRSLLEEKAFEFMKNKAKDNHHAIVKSPMPGLVIKIKKKIGEKVELGESLVILEAMKMENNITATASGIIKEIPIEENNAVEKNEVLVVIG